MLTTALSYHQTDDSSLEEEARSQKMHQQQLPLYRLFSVSIKMMSLPYWPVAGREIEIESLEKDYDEKPWRTANNNKITTAVAGRNLRASKIPNKQEQQ